MDKGTLPGISRPLTKRQVAVMERVDRRVPIKVIAQELGVSETRINQHIRALKDLYGADNLRDLVDLYRLDKRIAADSDLSADLAENQGFGISSPPLSEDAYNISQVPNSVFGVEGHNRDSSATVELQDVLPMIDPVPWPNPEEPRVVPGMLNGEHALILRLAAIVGIAFGLLAAVVLTATAAIMISEALSARAAIPNAEQGFA